MSKAGEELLSYGRLISFGPREIEEMRREAAWKNERSEKASWTVAMTSDYNFKGILGEEIFSALTGIKRKRYRFGDGGLDFPGIDIKADRVEPDSRICRLIVNKGTVLRAPNYGVVGLESDHSGSWRGFATSELLLTEGQEEDFGFGPRLVLYDDDHSKLNHSFPLEVLVEMWRAALGRDW